MTQFPEWKNSATDAVLDLLARAGVALSPGAIRLNLEADLQRPPSRTTVTRAIKGLRERGLIGRLEESKPYYRINEAGEAYLNDAGE
jgi:DNA-binding PadR family transcriptional regulator